MAHTIGSKPAPASKVRPLKTVRDISPVPVARRPVAPPWLSTEQRKAFVGLVRNMVDAGIEPFNSDTATITALACAIVLHRQAVETLTREGITIAGRAGGTVRHPASITALAATNAIDRLCSSLGLNPQERGRMRRPNTEAAQDTPEAYFAG
jgi:P27 family predicted phage terminase small subunit